MVFVQPWKRADGQQVTVNGKRSWHLRFETQDGGTGKRSYKHETFHGSKRGAEKRWIARSAEIHAATAAFVDPSSETLRAYLERWLEGRQRELRPTTLTSYGQMIRVHVLPALGDVPLNALSPARLERWLGTLQTTSGPSGRAVSPRTAAYCRVVLRTALRDATRLGDLAANPIDRTRPPKQNPRRVGTFTAQQVEGLLAAAGDWQPLYALAAYSGLRRGELLGLQWPDVDMEAKTLTVSRSLVKTADNRHGAVQKPKTAAGVRTVALPGLAMDALRAQRGAQARHRLAAGPTYQDAGWVFATGLGASLVPDDTSRTFSRICAAAGLPPLSFHSLRHTAASLQLAAGVPLETVSKRLGHATLATTADVYGHLLPEANAAAAGKVDDFMAGLKKGG